MKKILPLIIILAILLVGAWWFFGRGKEVTLPGAIKKEVGQESGTLKGKLQDMLASGIPLKCEFKNESMSGTSYMKDKKFYAEITGGGRQGFIIMKDNCFWTWDKDSNQGVKMCSESSEEGIVSEDFWKTQGQASSPEGEYTCNAAVFPESKFDPPTDVRFIDMNQGFGIQQ
jgi:hypothetical protein